MDDPFNPGRFVYETHSQSELVRQTRTTRQEENTPAQPRSNSPAEAGTMLALAGRSLPNRILREAIDVVGGGHVRNGCGAGWTIVCILLVAISSYTLGRGVERSSSLSPYAGGVSPDVRAYVDQAVLRLSRDAVGQLDFALYAHGARVIQELTGVVSGDALVLPYTNSSPNISLTDDTRAGSCWKFPQEAGQLGFRTSKMLFPTHVTIDHLPIEIAADIGQAPRTMALWGALDGGSNTESFRDISSNLTSLIPPHVGRTEPYFTANLTFVILATFEYDIYSPNNVQTFSLNPLIVDARLFFGVFILDILSNWGSDATCLYRIRVHGECAFQ